MHAQFESTGQRNRVSGLTENAYTPIHLGEMPANLLGLPAYAFTCILRSRLPFFRLPLPPGS